MTTEAGTAYCCGRVAMYFGNTAGLLLASSGVEGRWYHLSSRQRVALGQTLRELANLAAAALVFGQFVGQGFLSWGLVILGTVFWMWFGWGF